MMNCEWGHEDCINQNDKCLLCIIDSQYYKPFIRKNTGFKKTLKVKESSRQGSISEVKAFNQLSQTIDAPSVQGTPNSGAGKIKGDMQIVGLVNAMLEMKTTVNKNAKKAPGKESFTIKREWLDKLKREAKEANKEIFSLVFSFKEFDDQFYTVMEMEHLADIIATMKHDRLALKNSENQIDVYKKKATLIDAENTKLRAQIEYLEAKIKASETETDL